MTPPPQPESPENKGGFIKWLRYACLDSHQHGPLLLDKFRATESLQLHPPFDKKEQTRFEELSYWQERTAKRLRWLMDPIVGIGCAVCAVLLQLITEYFWDLRIEAVKHILEHGSASLGACLLALLVGTLAALGMTTAAAIAVAWQPQAASSGIPGVLAFLNGCDWRNALTLKVLPVKVVGTALACAAGLAVGPEGPMIHIGTIVGMQAVHRIIRPLIRVCMGKHGKVFDRELAREPLRYHIQAAAMGSGAGVAAAFMAPLAGTVFICEEAASYFSKRLFYHSMLTCAFAVLATMALSWLVGLKETSMYSKTVQCNVETAWSGLLLVQAVQVGIFCGILGALFNKAIVTMNRVRSLTLRDLGMTRRLIIRRIIEVMVITVATAAFAVLVPTLAACQDASLQTIFHQSSGCLPEDWQMQLVTAGVPATPSQAWGPKLNDGLELAWLPAPGLFGVQYDPVNCREAVKIEPKCNISIAIQGTTGKYISPGLLANPDYCCGFRSLDDVRQGKIFSAVKPVAPLTMVKESWPTASCAAHPVRKDSNNFDIEIPQYSPLASLLLAKPRVVVKNLMTRGAPFVLPVADLCIFLAGYLTLASVTSGAWVPSGLVLPMMIIGASVGRLSGIMWISLLKGSAGDQPTVPWKKEIEPLLRAIRPAEYDFDQDPGVLAMVGAAAFLSGSGALLLFVIVLMLELTWDPYIIPVMVLAMVIARITAAIFGSHGLYHELIEVQSFPLMPEHEHWRQRSWKVKDIIVEDEKIACEFEQGGSTWGQATTEETFRALGRVQSAPTLAAPGAPYRRHTQELPLGSLPASAGLGSSSTGVVGEYARTTGSASAAAFTAAAQDWNPGMLVFLKRVSTLSEIQAALDRVLPGDRQPMINGFPVVEDERGRLCGLISRSALQGIRKQCFERAGVDMPERTNSISGRHDALGRSLILSFADFEHMPAAARPTDWRGSGTVPPPTESQLARVGEDVVLQERLDIGDAMDAAPWILEESVPVHHAHLLFRSTGIRHVVIIDKNYRPIGILTRKSLMPWRMPKMVLDNGEPEHDSFERARMEGSPRPARRTLDDDSPDDGPLPAASLGDP